MFWSKKLGEYDGMSLEKAYNINGHIKAAYLSFKSSLSLYHGDNHVDDEFEKRAI